MTARATFDYQPTLEGPLVRLRPVTSQDFAALFAVGGDPKVWAGHPNADRYQEQAFRAYFEDRIASGGALVVEDAGADEIEIGWTFLGCAWWGGAHNAEMKRLMLDHAFRYVPKVIFRIGETNVRSRRAAEKIGARLIAGRRTPSPSPGGPDNLFYVIERR